ncbi:GHKL domain-containing protein [Coprobacillus cateniformis]|uniref:GHKL domain-containing protein n=1 Tax=Coprobacillus cateniformis TaxID=100884 RepID=UPI0026663A27|nr:GHKL domain-containing protein [Coprobacillus cateniformis]
MNILNLIAIFENIFIMKTLELIIPEIKMHSLVSFLMSILLTVECLTLSFTGIGENEKLLIPILSIFIFYSIKGSKILSSLLKIFIVFLNLTLVKLIVITTSTIVIGTSFQNFYNNYAIMFILTCVSIVLLGIEYVFIKNYYDGSFQLSGHSIIILSLCSVVTFVIINVILREYVLGSISFGFCASLVAVFILFLFLVTVLCVLNAKYYDSNLEQSLRLEAYDYEDKYINAITERTVEYNKLRHDMKNHFDIVERMINTSRIQEAKDYMEQISFDQGEHYVHVNHLVLNYILSNKTKLAKSHGIDLCSVIIGKPVTFIADVDYSILVGNLLDNAIEATIEAKENEVNLCLSFYEDRFVIEVKNCVVDKPKSKQLLTNKKDNYIKVK